MVTVYLLFSPGGKNTWLRKIQSTTQNTHTVHPGGYTVCAFKDENYLLNLKATTSPNARTRAEIPRERAADCHVPDAA